MLYVFCCKNGKCNEYRVFRSQLPQQNDYYHEDQDSNRLDPDYDPTPEMLAKRLPTCAFCGCRADNRCAKCKLTHYCSKEHQSLDWDLGHREQCAASDMSLPKRKASFHFKELMIVCDDVEQPKQKSTSAEGGQSASDDEDDSDEEDEDDYESFPKGDEIDDDEQDIQEKEDESKKEAMAHYQSYLDASGKSNEFSEKTFSNIKDKELAVFNNATSSDKDQILRNKEYKVLWVSEKDVPTNQDIPACPHCQGSRRFEMQVLPQLLYFLDVDQNHATSITEIDYGVLTIYTCSNSCEYSNANGFLEEFVWKQNFTN
eukprot:gene8383-9855_t